jgi:hypothetical protein
MRRGGSISYGSICSCKGTVSRPAAAATAWIAVGLEHPGKGWLRIQLGHLDQTIPLVSMPRHFGGRQWYFICPYMNQRASVLWRNPYANDRFHGIDELETIEVPQSRRFPTHYQAIKVYQKAYPNLSVGMMRSRRVQPSQRAWGPFPT